MRYWMMPIVYCILYVARPRELQLQELQACGARLRAEQKLTQLLREVTEEYVIHAPDKQSELVSPAALRALSATSIRCKLLPSGSFT